MEKRYVLPEKTVEEIIATAPSDYTVGVFDAEEAETGDCYVPTIEYKGGDTVTEYNHREVLCVTINKWEKSMLIEIIDAD